MQDAFHHHEPGSPGAWVPRLGDVLVAPVSRVELLDEDDPTGALRADDHVLGRAVFVTLALVGVIAVIDRSTVALAAPIAVSYLACLWLRDLRSGLWITPRGVRAVSFPSAVDLRWGTLHVSVHDGLLSQHLVVTGPDGERVRLSIHQLASGYVFNGSRRWRTQTLEVLATHLQQLDRALG